MPQLRFEFWFIVWLIPFLLICSLAPSPLFAQYFYPLFPFLVLAGLYGTTSLAPQTRAFHRTLWAGAALVITSAVLGHQACSRVGRLASPSEWTAMQIHQRAIQVFASVPPGPILTLAPLHPLEAGRGIYPALSTGPFAWRVSQFVEPARAVRLGMVSPMTLEALLRKTPPAAIWCGANAPARGDFHRYAGEHCYQLDKALGEGRLWLRR